MSRDNLFQKIHSLGYGLHKLHVEPQFQKVVEHSRDRQNSQY